jgi:hypothetical protein
MQNGKDKRMKVLWLLLLGCLFFTIDIAVADDMSEAQGGPQVKNEPASVDNKEIIYIVNEYRYEPGNAGGNADIGQALCGTRCNALSADYQNYLKPPGWRIIRTASSKEVEVDLNNPFIDGHCICIADEYVVRVNELYMVK